MVSTFSKGGMEGVTGLLLQLPDMLQAPGLMPSLLYSALIGNVQTSSWGHPRSRFSAQKTEDIF